MKTKEEMAEDCCSNNGTTMILAYSGRFWQDVLSGGQFSGFVQSARDVEKLMVIDGCQVGCAKAVMDNAKIPMKIYVILTDLGIEKNKNVDLQQEDIAVVKDAVHKCFG
jgi:uncharacterized metal-binding protein